MGVTCLQEQAERAYGAVCLHGRVLSFVIEKNLAAVATLPAAQGLPSVAGRLGRPSRPIATFWQ